MMNFQKSIAAIRTAAVRHYIALLFIWKQKVAFRLPGSTPPPIATLLYYIMKTMDGAWEEDLIGRCGELQKGRGKRGVDCERGRCEVLF